MGEPIKRGMKRGQLDVDGVSFIGPVRPVPTGPNVKMYEICECKVNTVTWRCMEACPAGTVACSAA